MKIYFKWLNEWIELEEEDYIDGNPFSVFKDNIKELLIDQEQLKFTQVYKNHVKYYIRNMDIVYKEIDK